jgi:hypothetical protein
MRSPSGLIWGGGFRHEGEISRSTGLMRKPDEPSGPLAGGGERQASVRRKVPSWMPQGALDTGYVFAADGERWIAVKSQTFAAKV